jgi:hypothetical protein
VGVKLSREDQTLAAQVSAERLWDFTANIAQKVRLSGSPDERDSFRYIAKTLTRWGFEIEEHRPECWTSWPGGALLEIMADEPVSIPCITHAMAVSTPPDGVVLDLVNAGSADAEALTRQSVSGRVAVCAGLAMPAKVFRVEAAGAAAQIHVCDEHMHEMITSIVWGSPTREGAHLLPKTPIVSVDKQGGAKLHEAMRWGRARVRIRAQVDTAWRALPILIAHLRAPKGNGDFVLFSGHVDSWHYGAMDNASANATQLEVGRIMADRRSRLRRDLRLAFWSGHSHARYAGSAWYADHFWQDLYDHCVLHLNVDSIGAKGATLLSEAIAMAEVRDFASAVVEKVAGQRLTGTRPQRAGDQSFWGHGVPSLFMTLSEQPPDATETARAFALLMGGLARSGGLGWWWHTTEDTLDKLDPALMVRDAQIYLLVTQRLLEDPPLPLDYRAVAKEAREILTGYLRGAKRRLDLGPVLSELDRLAKCLNALHRIIDKRKLAPGAVERINRCLVTIGRELIPIGYTRSGPFGHDTTLPVPPYPGLEPMLRLGSMDPKCDEARQLCVELIRERNKVAYHFHRAVVEVEATLASLPRPRGR